MASTASTRLRKDLPMPPFFFCLVGVSGLAGAWVATGPVVGASGGVASGGGATGADSGRVGASVAAWPWPLVLVGVGRPWPFRPGVVVNPATGLWVGTIVIGRRPLL